MTIERPNDVHNWDDLLNPSKMDFEEHERESMKRLMNSYKESIEFVDKSNFIISISRKILP